MHFNNTTEMNKIVQQVLSFLKTSQVPDISCLEIVIQAKRGAKRVQNLFFICKMPHSRMLWFISFNNLLSYVNLIFGRVIGNVMRYSNEISSTNYHGFSFYEAYKLSISLGVHTIQRNFSKAFRNKFSSSNLRTVNCSVTYYVGEISLNRNRKKITSK